MADRTSAANFARQFERLAKKGTAEAKRDALEVWQESQQYDFSPCQMCCDEALEALDLLRRPPSEDPDFDVDYEYGPIAETESAPNEPPTEIGRLIAERDAALDALANVVGALDRDGIGNQSGPVTDAKSAARGLLKASGR